jgi:ligand-binding sensor domain-containing protein
VGGWCGGTVGAGGYWLLERDGDIHRFGAAPDLPGVDLPPGIDAVTIASRPQGDGFWVLSSDGDIHARGGAVDFGRVDIAQLTKPGERATTMSAMPDGAGLWVFTSAGRILSFGSAPPASSLLGAAEILALQLEGPVISAVATPTGAGAYMVASDGGVFAVGDAEFRGSVRGQLTQLHGPPGLPAHPIVGIVSDPDGRGYWMVGRDGGVFSFDAPFRGSLPAQLSFEQLFAPINAMVPYGNGYLLIGGDGGVFTYSEKPFAGSASGQADSAVVDIATA